MAIPEDTFIRNVINDSASGVCICDLPGMGKTLLLAKISDKIGEMYPDRLVAFIPLSQFVKSVASNGIPPNWSGEEAQKFVVEYLASSSLAQDILKKMLSKGAIRMELLFDAFDEVPFQFISFTKKLLTELVTNLSNARIYVTSRPHMRQELEDSLGVNSYDILQFSEANQLEFLVNFWKRQNGVDDDEKLEQFAKYILRKLKTSLSKSEQNMTGIPLQCRLLAQVYSRGAKLYATRNIPIQECCHFEGSLPHLYREYVQQSFEKKLSTSIEVCFYEVQQYHVMMAIKTLFPDFDSQLFLERTADMAVTNSVVDLSISIGILERRVDGGGLMFEFVHRTFAEYFVADFIAQLLNNSQLTTGLSTKSKGEMLMFLLKKALMTREISDEDEIEEHIFINFVVVYFLDFFVDFYRPLTSIKQLAEQFPSSVSPEHLNGIFFGCAHQNYTKLIKFIRDILLCMEDGTLELYENEMLLLGEPQRIIRLLNVASLFSSHSFVQELFTLALECFEYDLNDVCKEMPLNQDTPLHFAIERADIEMVQFFVSYVSLEGRDILRRCVIGSNEYPLETVNRKADICKILLGINKNLLKEANYSLYDNVHVELIKLLVEAGADARATESGENIVHRSAGYMSNSDFQELSRFLILDLMAEELFVANVPIWKSPLVHIFQRQEKLSIETCSLIMGIDGVDINERDDHQNNLFLIAVEKKYDMELLDFLVKSGADIHAINAEGQNALHLAVEAKNTEVLTFLLNLGINHRQRDTVGNSILHLLGSEGVTAEEYQEIISVLIAKRLSGIFHVKNNAGQLPIHWAVYNLEVNKQTLQILKSHPYPYWLKSAVRFNGVDNDGWSVLMYATRGGRSAQFLRLLIDMGADVLIRNKNGETFAHLISKYCTAEQYHELAVFLFSEGLEKVFTTKDKRECTPLHWAAFFIELLPETLDLIHRKLVLKNNVDINTKCRNGCSIFMYAAAGKRSPRMLKTLIKMGADVYIEDVQYSPKYLKTYPPGDRGNRDDELLKRTRTKISSSKSENSTGYSVLINAAEGRRSVRFLKNMIERGADVHNQNKDGDNFAHCIAYYYSPEQYHDLVEFLIGTGQHEVFAVPNNNRQTPIHIAVYQRKLLESTLDLFNSTIFKTKIVDINFKDKSGNSLLMCAAYDKRSVSLLKSLIENGADIHIQNKYGDNFAHLIPSYYSAEQYHDLVEFIILRGQRKVFTVANHMGFKPIHYAIYRLELYEETLKLLLACYVLQNHELSHTPQQQHESISNCLNAVDNFGRSVLHWALSGTRSLHFVKHLISLGADWTAKSNYNQSLAHYSAWLGLSEHLKYFVELGCDVNALDNDEDNVLHHAVYESSEYVHEMVTFLLEKGADKYHKNKEEHTAYTYAVKIGITDTRVLDALK